MYGGKGFENPAPYTLRTLITNNMFINVSQMFLKNSVNSHGSYSAGSRMGGAAGLYRTQTGLKLLHAEAGAADKELSLGFRGIGYRVGKPRKRLQMCSGFRALPRNLNPAP